MKVLLAKANLPISALFVFPSIHLEKNSHPAESESDLNHQLIQTFNAFPQHFVENRGQVDDRVKHSLKIPSGNVFFTPASIFYQFVYRQEEAKKYE